MNTILKSLLTITTLTAGSQAFGQGLLSLRPARDEFERKMPFAVTLSAGAGYDSNANTSKEHAKSSSYLNAGVGIDYQGGDRRTNYTVGASYGAFYYLDPPDGSDSYLQNARVNFSLRHKFSETTSLTDSAYVAYEFEPNYAIGSGTTRRSNEYLYYYNDIALSHAWSRTFSTTTGFTISGFDYQKGDSEDYKSYLFHQEFRYALTKLTALAVDYRYSFANYDNGFGDYTSQYFLAGLDHHFNRALFGSFRVGAEIRDRDNGGSNSNPYFEGNLSYRADKHTSFNTYARYGFEDSSVGSFQSRESLRVGVTGNHALTDRLNLNAGLHYIHDTSEDSASGEGGFTDNVFSLGAGLDYALYKNISLTTNYGFTTTSSGNASREYNRHNVSVGVRATF